MTDTETTAPTPRYYALSGLGWGRGNTPGEAIENYVESNSRNWKMTIFKSRAGFEKALRTGDAKPQVWHAPEGATGFVQDTILRWQIGDEYVPADYRTQLLDDTVKRDTEGAASIVTYISHEGSEVGDLQDLVDGKEAQLNWVGTLNGEDVPITLRLAETVEDVRGCSCGMADYGAPGHEGHEG